jgi:hypothetical protein
MAECASNASAKNTSVITDHPFRLARLRTAIANKPLVWNMGADGQTFCLTLERHMHAVDGKCRERM